MIDTSTSAHYVGDTRTLLRELPDGCVRTCITSPPYWGLRSYLPDGHPLKAYEIGLEPTPALYLESLMQVFREVWRVLADDGTLWLNLGDSYAGSRSGPQGTTGQFNDLSVAHQRIGAAPRSPRAGLKGVDPKYPGKGQGDNNAPNRARQDGLKHKDLVGIPWRVAFALQAEGWYLRSDIIWHKPNPMPESVEDRPTKAHEYIFLLSKSERYYYDIDAIREPCVYGDHPRNGVSTRDDDQSPGQARQTGISKVRASGNKERKQRADHGGPLDTGSNQAFGVPWQDEDGRRNKRSVWTVTTQPYRGSHFATFPPALIEPCVLAGSAAGDLVLDPFFGSGTVGQVAEKHMRRWIGFDINDAYEQLAKERTAQRTLRML